MPQHRRAAWALVVTLLASLAGFAVASPSAVVLAADPVGVCPGDQMPTRWTDEYHPPDTIRVLRSKGPNAGKVETVNFWKYVGTVVRAEYSSGSDKPYPWMQIGAITVKQYAWYYTMHWRGGKVTVDEVVQCYDVKDTTADQIYTDLKWDTATNDWKVANEPTPPNLKAMRETWHMTLRKWQSDKFRSRFFLTGYRSGKQRPCGDDSTGFKIYQKSLRDCGVKKLTLEETLREYYEPNMLLVDTRGHDMLADSGIWRGDVGLLVPATGNWHLFAGTADGFSAGANGSLGVNVNSVLGHGVGDTTGAASNGAADDKLLADLILLVNSGGSDRQLRLLRANGTSLEAAVNFAIPPGTPAEKLLVGDFNGDRLADAGLLGPSGGQTKLSVMRAQTSGGFSDPVDWWTGALNLTGDVFLAGDANGDGKADLITRDATGAFNVAVSPPSCSDLTAWGVCPAGAVGANGLGALAPWLLVSDWPAEVKAIAGDWDRDGRDDVLALVRNGSGIKVIGLRSKSDNTFAAPLELWQSSSIAFGETLPGGLNINPDGMADLALFQKDGTSTKLMWLRAVERSSGPATMTATTPFNTGLNWAADNRPF